jgi:hypothetical protein
MRQPDVNKTAEADAYMAKRPALEGLVRQWVQTMDRGA